MRRLLTTELFIHHTVTPQSWTKRKTVNLILRSHTDRGLAYDREVAYHRIIGKDWVYKGRDLDTVGYHSGSWSHNLRSVSVALSGNFNTDKPTKYQLEQLKRFIGELWALYGPLKVRLHRDVKNTACPGQNITHELINGILEDMAIEKLQEEIRALNTEIGDVTKERDRALELLDRERASHKETVKRAASNYKKWQEEIDKRRKCESKKLKDMTLLEKIRVLLNGR